MAAEGRNAPPPEAPPSTPPVSAGTGRVVVHTKPDGARVIVDGKQTGYKTPVNFALPSGAHLITLERNGVTETRRVLVEPNGITQIEIRIENRSGLLRRLPFRN